MTTKIPRVNVTFDAQKLALLSTLAKENNQSLSHFIKELALEALEQREDLFLAKLALQRDAENDNQTLISHESAWS